MNHINQLLQYRTSLWITYRDVQATCSTRSIETKKWGQPFTGLRVCQTHLALWLCIGNSFMSMSWVPVLPSDESFLPADA